MLLAWRQTRLMKLDVWSNLAFPQTKSPGWSERSDTCGLFYLARPIYMSQLHWEIRKIRQSDVLMWPTYRSMWGNPESGIQHVLAFGIQNPWLWNQESSPWNPESLESRSEMYCTVSSNFITNHQLHPSLGVPYPDHHHQNVFGHLTCTSTMSTLRLGGFWFLIGHMFHTFKIIFLTWRLSELLWPWPALSPKWSTSFTVIFFHAGFHIELHVVVSNVYRFTLLFW